MQLKISEMMDNLLPEDEVDVPMEQPHIDTDRVKALVQKNISPVSAVSRATRSARRRKRRPLQLGCSRSRLAFVHRHGLCHRPLF